MPYAITATGCRAISSTDDLEAGETFAEDIPQALLSRMRRNEAESTVRTLLQGCAWTQDGDAPLNASEKAAWLAYRVSLRALSSHPEFPDVAWPAPPRTGGVGSETGEQS